MLAFGNSFTLQELHALIEYYGEHVMSHKVATEMKNHLKGEPSKVLIPPSMYCKCVDGRASTSECVNAFKSMPFVDYDSVKAEVPFDAWVAKAKGLPCKHGKIVFSNGATLYYLHNHPLMLLP